MLVTLVRYIQRLVQVELRVSFKPIEEVFSVFPDRDLLLSRNLLNSSLLRQIDWNIHRPGQSLRNGIVGNDEIRDWADNVPIQA